MSYPSNAQQTFDFFPPKQTHGCGKNDLDFITKICRTFHLLRSLLLYIAHVPVYGSFNHWDVSAASLWAAQRWRTLFALPRWYQRTAQAVDFTLFEILVHVGSRPFTQVCMYEGEASPSAKSLCRQYSTVSQSGMLAIQTMHKLQLRELKKQTNKKDNLNWLSWFPLSKEGF